MAAAARGNEGTARRRVAKPALAAAAGIHAQPPEGTRQQRGHFGQAPMVIGHKLRKLLAWPFCSWRGVPLPRN